MKRILSIMLCVIVLFSLAACGEKLRLKRNLKYRQKSRKQLKMCLWKLRKHRSVPNRKEK